MIGFGTFQWNVYIRDCFRKGGSVSHVFNLYHRMLEQGVRPNKFTFSILVKISTAHSSPNLAVTLQAQIIKSRLGEDVPLATSLIGAFSEFLWFGSARKVFDNVPERDRDAPFWNSLLASYARNGHFNEAHYVFREMGLCGTKPTLQTLSILLPVCKEKIGRLLHGYVYRNWGGIADVFLHNCLLDFYNKWEKIEYSRSLFLSMPDKDLVSWNMMISGYVQNGLGHEALVIFHTLLEQGVNPDLVTLETVLHACAQVGNGAIADGELVHELLLQSKCLPNVYIENSMMLMYCKCGQVEEAENLFQQMHLKNAVSWNIIIDGHIYNGNPWKALQHFKAMRFFQMEVSSDSLVGALKATKLFGGFMDQVMCIHCLALIIGYNCNNYVNNSLIALYGEYGNIDDAFRCFQVFNIRTVEVLTWNVMLSVCVQNDCFVEAAKLLQDMKDEGCLYDATSFLNTILLCCKNLNFKLGKAAHGCIIRQSLDSYDLICSALLQFYNKCKLLDVTCQIFSRMARRNINSWNAMIYGCLDNGFPRVSLNLFHLLQERDGLVPDKATLVGVIKAISQRRHKGERNYIHECAVQLGLDKDEFVASSLISMYAQCGEWNQTTMVLDRTGKIGTSTWNTLIAEFAHYGFPSEAVSVFHFMRGQGIHPDVVTFLSLLPACAQLASMSYSMWIHSLVIKTGCVADSFVESALVSLYAKCGQVHVARFVFDQMSLRTIVSWNSMIWGYALHGNADKARKLFLEMEEQNIEANFVTYLAVLSACSHSGDVKNGIENFNQMMEKQSNLPAGMHCSAMVDLLSRKGLFLEAIQFIEKMPLGNRTCGWAALLGAARVQGNLQVGDFAASKLFKLDDSHDGYHVLLANLYSESGRWSDASTVRLNMTELGIKKQIGWSSIDLWN